VAPLPDETAAEEVGAEVVDWADASGTDADGR
jgi:hypothetical protein